MLGKQLTPSNGHAPDTMRMLLVLEDTERQLDFDNSILNLVMKNSSINVWHNCIDNNIAMIFESIGKVQVIPLNRCRDFALERRGCLCGSFMGLFCHSDWENRIE